MGFRTCQRGKGAGNDFKPHKGRGKDQKRKGKEGAYLQSGLSASETPSEEGYGPAWESNDWFSSLTDDSSCLATRELLDGLARELILHGWHQSL